jgi:tRNA dimethylallyltransferase
MPSTVDTLVVLGPTASGKTTLGVKLAQHFDGEIISADSRQVYRGLDIGSGKDLGEYTVGHQTIPYHLIDIIDLDFEFSVFDYQQRFFDAHNFIRAKPALPIVVGGTGLYLDAVLSGYEMAEVPDNPDLRTVLSKLSLDDLNLRLSILKDSVHNKTDSVDRERVTRAIEIAEYSLEHPPESTPKIHPLILGTRWERSKLHDRIEFRLKERLDQGMVEEVESLRARGIPDERLQMLGLEYRFITDYLIGTIKNKNDLMQKLLPAIKNFAKRQETWFRRMERNGTVIRWIGEGQPSAAIQMVEKAMAQT